MSHVNKERATFYLRRILRDLEEKATFDQEKAAKQGMPYGERLTKAAEAEKYQHELQAMTWVMDVVQSAKE